MPTSRYGINTSFTQCTPGKEATMSMVRPYNLGIAQELPLEPHLTRAVKYTTTCPAGALHSGFSHHQQPFPLGRRHRYY